MTRRTPSFDREVEELLPLYVNGTLGDADRRRIDALRAENAELDAEIAFLSALARGVKAAEDNDREVRSPGELGLRRLQRELRTQDETAGQTPAPRAASPAVSVKGGPVGRLALVASLALVIGLGAGMLTMNLVQTDRFTAAGGDPGTERERGGARLHLVFRSDATAADIEALLRSERLEIVAGPSALGLYTVAADARDGGVQALLQSLRARDDVVEQVTLE
ncbi:hypothetical protein [Algihabitans sp.]|uniref:hypothetical protein n=1 Tax=Algihabitans sp. TaxID=2821514 RepID=UPI003BAB1FF8